MSEPFTTLVSTDDLAGRLADPGWIVVDARFNLLDAGRGHAQYLEGHVPGAVYAHLDEDLSASPSTGGGRHPLPSPEVMREAFARLGIGNRSQVVVYDYAEGAIAARLWWMLRYLGHEAAAVLDGGWKAWNTAGLPVAAGAVHRERAVFRGEPNDDWLVTADQLPGASLLVDARDPKRYRGEQEPIDPVAGHIPGAVNRYLGRNVDEDGRFLPASKLAPDLRQTFGSVRPQDTVHYCGSGVSACHNLLAMAHAGLEPGRLYVGSWSEWCADPARPVATGDN